MTDLFADMVDDTAPKGPFEVTDLGSAGWVMRKLLVIRRKVKDIEETAERDKRLVTEWCEAEVAKLTHKAAHFEGLLADYHQRVLGEDERAKTITLPHGKLTFRAQQPTYTRNDDELLAWARATSPELVVVTESPNWAEIKQYGKAVGNQLFDPATGEVIPGVTVTERPAKFAITLDEGESA